MSAKADMTQYETQALDQGLRFIFGVDEAGRGPLAGPVVASAVYLKTFHFENRIDDSKKMSARQREAAFHEIYDKAYVGIGVISEVVIDTVNILNAAYLAMDAAVRQLISYLPEDQSRADDFKQRTILLIDGNGFRTQLPYRFKTIVSGDAKSLSIACASIVAKVYRDRVMENYHQIYPKYGFDQHKGYGTQMHRDAIMQYGVSKIHRRSFTHV